MINPEKVSRRKVKKFLKHVVHAHKNHSGREQSRKELIKQLRETKKAAITKGKKTKDIKKQFDDLQKKVDTALDKHAKLIKLRIPQETFVMQVSTKVDALNHKLDEYINVFQDREKRIKELEQKITKREKNRQSRADIKDQIEELEERYDKLKGKHSKSVLSSLKRRIDKLKTKVA